MPELSHPLITRLTLKNWLQRQKDSSAEYENKNVRETWSLQPDTPLSQHYLVCRCSLANQPAIAHHLFGNGISAMFLEQEIGPTTAEETGQPTSITLQFSVGLLFFFSEDPKPVRSKLTAVEIAFQRGHENKCVPEFWLRSE